MTTNETTPAPYDLTSIRADGDKHRVWLDQHAANEEWLEQRSREALSESERDAISEQFQRRDDELVRLIQTTPATTLDGLQAQIELLARLNAGVVASAADHACYRNMVRTIEGLKSQTP